MAYHSNKNLKCILDPKITASKLRSFLCATSETRNVARYKLQSVNSFRIPPLKLVMIGNECSAALRTLHAFLALHSSRRHFNRNHRFKAVCSFRRQLQKYPAVCFSIPYSCSCPISFTPQRGKLLMFAINLAPHRHNPA